MKTLYHYKHCLILLAFSFAVNDNRGQTQDFQPELMPTPSQAQLADDQQKVENLRAYADTYSSQVNDYITRIQEQSKAIDAQREIYAKQSEVLEKEIHDNPKQSSAEKTELSSLRTKIHSEDSLKQLAAHNIQTALGWVSYVRAQVNNAQYNISEDQQQLADDALRAQNALEEQEQRAALRGILDQNILNGYSPLDQDYYDYGYGNPVPPYLNPYLYRHDHWNGNSTRINDGVRGFRGGGGVIGGGGISGGGGLRGGGGGGTRGGGGGGGRR